MVTVLILILLALVICFGSVLLFGAPYLPTLKRQVEAALTLADLKAGDTLLELGSGDGKVVLAAAKKGITVVGYELNPLLVIVSRIRTIRYRKNVKIVWGDFWSKPWPEAQAIFVFLLPKYMDKLNNKCIQYPYKPLKLISFAFKIENKKPTKSKAGVFLYNYND